MLSKGRDTDPTKPKDEFPVFLLFGTILAIIWWYYFAFVIKGQDFEPWIVLSFVDLAIVQFHAQLTEKKCQSKKRQPRPPVVGPPDDTNHPT
jgi:apolipoprotein N-acyltransferase